MNNTTRQERQESADSFWRNTVQTWRQKADPSSVVATQSQKPKEEERNKEDQAPRPTMRP